MSRESKPMWMVLCRGRRIAEKGRIEGPVQMWRSKRTALVILAKRKREIERCEFCRVIKYIRVRG